MARIEVAKAGESEFDVRIVDADGASSHRVTVRPEDYRRLTGGKMPPEELVRRSFEFLLEQEPKESILGRFDLLVIARYFPQYEREIKNRLTK